MPLIREISEQEIKVLQAKALKIKGRREFRRLQSILLRAKEGKSTNEIASILGIHSRTVQEHQRRYFQEGMKALEERILGPKGPKLLTAQEETQLFNVLREQAATGCLLKAGKACSFFTLYAVLKRNGWSKKPAPSLIRGPIVPSQIVRE